VLEKEKALAEGQESKLGVKAEIGSFARIRNSGVSSAVHKSPLRSKDQRCCRKGRGLEKVPG